MEGDFGVALNGGCRGVVSTQLGGIDANLDGGSVRGRDAPFPGGHAAEAGADGDDEVRRRDDAVGAPVGVATDDADVEGMVGGEGHLAVEGCGDGDGQHFGELGHFVPGAGGHDAGAGDDDGAAGLGDEAGGFLHVFHVGFGTEGGVAGVAVFDDHFQVGVGV